MLIGDMASKVQGKEVSNARRRRPQCKMANGSPAFMQNSAVVGAAGLRPRLGLGSFYDAVHAPGEPSRGRAWLPPS